MFSASMAPALFAAAVAFSEKAAFSVSVKVGFSCAGKALDSTSGSMLAGSLVG